MMRYAVTRTHVEIIDGLDTSTEPLFEVWDIQDQRVLCECDNEADAGKIANALNVSLVVRRMSTSREGPTKYEHFTVLRNGHGKDLDLWMRHNPSEALYQAFEVAQHLGVDVDPLVIEGEPVQLDDVMKMMLRKD